MTDFISLLWYMSQEIHIRLFVLHGKFYQSEASWPRRLHNTLLYIASTRLVHNTVSGEIVDTSSEVWGSLVEIWMNNYLKQNQQLFSTLMERRQVLIFCTDTSFLSQLHIILLYSLHYEKSSITWVSSRSFSVPCASFSMLGSPGGTGCNEVRFPHKIVAILDSESNNSIS
jgi:hypothetical protein